MHFRADFGDFAEEILDADTPGSIDQTSVALSTRILGRIGVIPLPINQ